MRDLVVDLTPTCINRTAIYHVAMDTAAALRRDFEITPQYRGARRPRLAGRPSAIATAKAFFDDIARWATQPMHHDEFDPGATDPAPRLYFDPIYTLYRTPRAQDVVFVLDMSTLTHPEWHDTAVARAYERAFRTLMESPAKVVCTSTHGATALRTSFSIPQGDIAIIPLYLRAFPRHDAASTRFGLRQNQFFLFVGTLETRKNLMGLMRAFALTGLAAEGWTLVIAGANGQGHAAILQVAADLPSVEILGFVSDGDLAWLYVHAAAFTYPSFLEGFGLPLLEAMAHGLPCLASITGASPEVCGNEALLVDPYDIGSIVDGLLTLAKRASEPDTASRRRVARFASDFTFQRYMEALLPVLGPAHA